MNERPRNRSLILISTLCDDAFVPCFICSFRLQCSFFGCSCTLLNWFIVLILECSKAIRSVHIPSEISSLLTFHVLSSSSFSCRYFSGFSLWMAQLLGIARSITTAVFCTLSIIYSCVQFRSVCTVAFSVSG